MTPDEIATDRVLVETLAEAHAEGREGGDLSWCDALVHRAIGRDEGPALVKEDIIDLATALNCPVERLTVSREELERRLEEADELANDLVSHLEHERALRRQDREAANALRQSHDEIEVLLEVIEERFPETSAVINAVVAYDRANALRARVAELTNAIMDLVPMGYAGATVEDKLRNYVEDLRKRASEPYQTAEFDALVADKCKAWQKAAAARRAEAKALARVAELEAETGRKDV